MQRRPAPSAPARARARWSAQPVGVVLEREPAAVEREHLGVLVRVDGGEVDLRRLHARVLNPRWELDPELDDMDRDWVGWDETRSAEVNFERNRGIWLLGRRAERETYATFSLDGKIVMVAEISDIETIPPKDPTRTPKRAISGRVLGPADAAYTTFIGRLVDGHRNPVTYIPDPGNETRTCACGCGETVTGPRHFLPGHDQRAIHDRIARQWGDTLGFIEWFDATYPEITA